MRTRGNSIEPSLRNIKQDVVPVDMERICFACWLAQTRAGRVDSNTSRGRIAGGFVQGEDFGVATAMGTA